MSMNMSKKPARISIPALLSASTVEAFVLESEQPGEEGLYSRCWSIYPFITVLAGNLLSLCHVKNHFFSLDLNVKGSSRQPNAREEKTPSFCVTVLSFSSFSLFFFFTVCFSSSFPTLKEHRTDLTHKVQFAGRGYCSTRPVETVV